VWVGGWSEWIPKSMRGTRADDWAGRVASKPLRPMIAVPLVGDLLEAKTRDMECTRRSSMMLPAEEMVRRGFFHGQDAMTGCWDCL
jgi:hypothetical protein